ncbi:MAG: hypothetical protein ACRDJU_01730 [Actinomycetota bacterium]
MSTDWATASSLATAGGTLVLAIATFSAIRSANVAARTAERTLLAGLRPVLFPSRLSDPAQEIRWGDNHAATLEGGRSSVEHVDGVVYLAMSLRNVGAGIAVIHGWRAGPEERVFEDYRPEVEDFRIQLRDLYVPVGDASFWQAAVRDPEHPDRDEILEGIRRGSLIIDILYGDHEGGQRIVSRFNALRRSPESTTWECSVVRHWTIDRRDPRREG